MRNSLSALGSALLRSGARLGALVLIGASHATLARAQQTDSAGVRIINDAGPDRELNWKFRKRVVIGGKEDGPAAFFQVYPWNVAADGKGRIYALDVGNFAVSIFDTTGKFIARVGGHGGGPGEFQRPVGLTVDSSGNIAVVDAVKMSLVRFDSSYSIAPEQRLPEPGFAGPAARVAGYEVLAKGYAPTEQLELVAFNQRDTVTVAAVPPMRRNVTFDNCNIGLTGLRPFFAPVILWSSTGTGTGGIAVNATPEYRIDVYRGVSLTHSIRRNIPPVRVTKEMLHEIYMIREGMTIRFPDGPGCRIPGKEVLKKQGNARTTTPITGIKISPGGELWIERRDRRRATETVIDIFGNDGAYRGTLPATVQLPIAFITDNQVVLMSGTADGVPLLVIYAIDR